MKSRFYTREPFRGYSKVYMYDTGSRVYTPMVRQQAIQSNPTSWPTRHSRAKSPMFEDMGSQFHNSKIDVELNDWRPRLCRVNYDGSWGWMYQSYGLLVPGPSFESALNNHIGFKAHGHQWLTDKILSMAPSPLSNSSLTAAGSTAIARCVPTNPVVNLSTTIAELVGSKKFFSLPGKSKTASGEYLNLQLGILPVVSDVQNIWNAAQETEEILKQQERDSGKLVRRRYAFPEESTTTTVVDDGVYTQFLGDGGGLNTYLQKPGKRTTTITVSERIWFSGAFTYYLPQKGWRRNLAQYERQYGVTPGLETAWNVIPLSFVSDYFTNMGDVLHNLDRFARDGLVMPYGYVMCERITREHVTWQGPVANVSGTFTNTTVSGSVTYKTQQRLNATPFGFGLVPGDLSARQMSIIAALGLNRR